MGAEFFYVNDGEGNIVRSIDILAEKEYNYIYEDDRIVRATEADITLSGEIVTAKAIAVTVVGVCVVLPSLAPAFMSAVAALSAKGKALVSICTAILNGLRCLPA